MPPPNMDSIGGSLRDIAAPETEKRRSAVIRALARDYPWLAAAREPCAGLDAAAEGGDTRYYQAWPEVGGLDAAREEAQV